MTRSSVKTKSDLVDPETPMKNERSMGMEEGETTPCKAFVSIEIVSPLKSKVGEVNIKEVTGSKFGECMSRVKDEEKSRAFL